MSADSFTKLSSGILASTVWQEPNSTRIVWITMLALADRNGYVAASIPGLAHLARVTLQEVEAALATFAAPDPYSRTPDNEGRRIEAVAGGWRLLNHGIYRARRDADETKERKREWDRLNRPSGHARTKESPTQSDAVRQIRPNPTQAEADADAKEQEREVAALPPSPAEADEAQAAAQAAAEAAAQAEAAAKAAAEAAAQAKADPVCKIVLEAYHRHLPNCQAVHAMPPARRRRILAANKLAKSLIAQKSLGVSLAEFWDGYFAECAEDPWLSGRKPNAKNPNWKQNIDVLLRDDHFGDVMDKALSRDLGSPA